MQRNSINGAWILDKTRGEWSMRHYLAIMDVDPLAIEAHEKGEIEQDTIHTIELKGRKLKIVKRSRVNSDICVELDLGIESLTYLEPDNRLKRVLANSNHPGHLEIHSTLQTVEGIASVLDFKNLIQEQDKSILKQDLTITNEKTGKSATTTRYFLPYLETPPHLLVVTEEAK